MQDDRNLGDYNAGRRYNDSMRIHSTFLWAVAALAACAPPGPRPIGSALYVYRLDPPAFIELDADLKPRHEWPFSTPAGCGMGTVFPAPRGPRLAIELNCAFGPAVVWLNVETSAVEQPITDSDSHFLAWATLGDAVYLRIDSINRPRVVRRAVSGGQETLPITELTYDISPAPAGGDFLFTFSRGMGLGSEMWEARREGADTNPLAEDEVNYLALARWSPDGDRIAFIKIPDSAIPFTVGELWLMQADGTQARMLAKADAGHGFAPVWSPDGRQIAFVVRENADEARADTSATALISNLYLVDLGDGEVVRITDFPAARVESPAWQPDGDGIAFSAVVDDRMSVYLKDVTSGAMQPVPIESTCCATWLRQ
jgi:hypothetical protein